MDLTRTEMIDIEKVKWREEQTAKSFKYKSQAAWPHRGAPLAPG